MSIISGTVDTSQGKYIDINSYDSALNAIIVTSAGKTGVSGFVFDIPSGESLELDSDISEHYTENGSYIADHMICKPVIYKTGGFIGNLVYTMPQSGSVEYTADQITNRLASVNAYLGPFTSQATQIAAAIVSQVSYVANQAEALKKKATNLINYISGNDSTENPQQSAYKQLRALWKSKQIVSVQTPWEYFDKMLIKSIVSSHDDKSDSYTEFSISLQEARFADTEVTSFDNNISAPASDIQATAAENKGKVSGQTKNNNSVLYNIQQNGGWK